MAFYSVCSIYGVSALYVCHLGLVYLRVPNYVQTLRKLIQMRNLSVNNHGIVDVDKKEVKWPSIPPSLPTMNLVLFSHAYIILHCNNYKGAFPTMICSKVMGFIEYL